MYLSRPAGFPATEMRYRIAVRGYLLLVRYEKSKVRPIIQRRWPPSELALNSALTRRLPRPMVVRITASSISTERDSLSAADLQTAVTKTDNTLRW